MLGHTAEVLGAEGAVEEHLLGNSPEPRGADAAGPHVSQSNERFTFISPALDQLQRNPPRAQCVGELRGFLPINAIDVHPSRVGRDGFPGDRALQHIEHGEKVGDRLRVGTEEDLTPPDALIEHQLEVAPSPPRSGFVPLAVTGVGEPLNLRELLAEGILLLIAYHSNHHEEHGRGILSRFVHVTVELLLLHVRCHRVRASS